jgi:hypothetical protein
MCMVWVSEMNLASILGLAGVPEVVMCWLWPGGLSQPKLAVKSQAKPGFRHGFPKPVALALILESCELWL